MKALSPWAKAGVVFLGLASALLIAALVVYGHVLLTDGPAAQASAGMYAFGDLVLGLGVFGMLALLPIALGLYWLRPVAPFWSVLPWAAVLWVLTGVYALALAANTRADAPAGDWMLLPLARFGLMPLGALALLACAAFAPRPRQRWMLFATAVADGGIFAGAVLVFLLSSGGGV